MWKTGITQILDAFLVCSPHASLCGGQYLPQKRELVVCGKEGLHATFAVFSRAAKGDAEIIHISPTACPVRFPEKRQREREKVSFARKGKRHFSQLFTAPTNTTTIHHINFIHFIHRASRARTPSKNEKE
jgi:hypothetical protein